MKAWYSKVRDTELKDGSVRATYVVTFETDNAELKREVEKYLQGIMDRADRKTENYSEKPNNCEHITEDGVTCAKYPACDDCLDNPLNKVKGSERLVKGTEQTEPTHDLRTETHECVKDTHDKTESQICDTCRYYNDYIPCGSTPSACKEADRFAKEFAVALMKLKPQTERGGE